MTQFDKYIGMLVSGRYEIKRVLGVGGMAVVFLAYDRQEECDVALKMLKEEASTDESALQCFEDESRTISMLSHPNIRQIYDISISEDHKYLTMEYLDGPTLKSYVKEKGRISQDKALEFIIQILDALNHTHSKGIVHRDIKPQNVIVTSESSVKITDFGIAKLYDPHTKAQSDKGVGTVYYISPEQASGKNIDARSDIYSVGIMLYELVCHRLPFVAEDPSEVAYMQVNEEPQKPSEIVDLPMGLEQIILRAIAKNPDERFSDAGQMLAAVKRFKETPEAVFDFVSVPADSRFYGTAGQHSDADIILANPNEDEYAPMPITTKKDKKPKKKNKPKVITEVKTEVVKKSTPVSFISIIAGAVFACLIVAVMTVYYVYDNYIAETLSSSDAQLLVIEDFINRECDDELIANMKKLGYSVTVVKQPSTDYVIGTVISQKPEAGAKRTIIPGEKSCAITLYVSSGEEMRTLDNYIGQNYRDAVIKMNDLGFPSKVVKEYNALVPAGNIISTFPEAGSYITIDTLITVYVSAGQEIIYTTMPDLSDVSASEVRTLITRHELRLAEVTYQYSPTVPAGQVISQYPYYGTIVPRYITDVSIVVSMGVDPSTLPPEPEPEPEPESPDDGTDIPVGGTETPDDETETPNSGNQTPDSGNETPDGSGTDSSQTPPSPNSDT